MKLIGKTAIALGLTAYLLTPRASSHAVSSTSTRAAASTRGFATRPTREMVLAVIRLGDGAGTRGCLPCR